MAFTWAADVVPIAPNLATAPAATQTLVLAIVDRQIDVGVWGAFADDGRRYLAAHLGTLAITGGAGAAGPVTSESLGAMSRSYASLTGNIDPTLATTRFGVEYFRLLRIAVGIAAVVP